MRRATLRFTTLLLLAASSSFAENGLDPERLARIPERMQEFVEKGTAAGIVTLVQRHGEVASLKAVGYQDLETKKPAGKGIAPAQYASVLGRVVRCDLPVNSFVHAEDLCE